MIDLAKDLFVHLSLSAQALKEEEAQSQIRQKLIPKRPVLSDLEKTSYAPVSPAKTVKIEKAKTVEETIEDVVDNPRVKELKKELEAAEEVFEKLKDKGENMDFIYRIENKIEQLKKLIDQKSYF